MIENEFKLMLSADQYERVKSSCTWDEEITQINHYFDTDDLELSGRRITVRVREIEGSFFLQIKLPTEVEFSRVELEKRLDYLPEILRKDELESTARGVVFPDAKRLGALSTKRLVKRFRGAEIDLDESRYFDKTDYEIEVEFTDENEARELLQKIRGIIGESAPENEVCIGKIRRFLGEFLRRSSE